MDEKMYVGDVYSQIAKYFDNTRSYIWPWIRDVMQEIPSNSTILDIGCGNGRNMQACPSNCQVFGIDQCPELVQICQKRNLHAIVGDMCQMPFQDESFDLLLMIASFHHLSSVERRQQCLQECYRILKSNDNVNGNGNLLIATWCCKNEGDINIVDKIILYIVDRYFNSSLTWISIDTYKKHLNQLKFNNIKCDEWTKNVSIFWIYVLKSIFTRKGLYAMFCQGNQYYSSSN